MPQAANILLDERFNPVVADFGLAKLVGGDETHVTTAVRGTYGHIAPGQQPAQALPCLPAV